MTMRITGLSSGLDTDTIISQLMALERKPIDLWNTKKDTLTTEKDTWRDVNTRVSSLKEKISSLSLSSKWSALTVASSDESIVTATGDTNLTESSYDIKVKQLAYANSLASDGAATITGNSSADADTKLYLAGTFKINDVNIDITGIGTGENDSLTGIKNAINSASFMEGEEVTASIINNTLVLKSANKGAAASINLTDSPSGILKSLGVLDSFDAVQNELQAGQDAIFKVNGLEVTRDKNEGITDVLEGITLNLNSRGLVDPTVTDPQPWDNIKTVSLSVSKDTTLMVSLIEDMVNQYNSAISFIKEKSSYDAETKTAGPLQGDYTASDIYSKLRTLAGDTYAGSGSTFTMLSEIGITTGAYGTADYGKLVLDTSKLESALAEDPEAVEELFTSSSGFATRVENYLTPLTRTGGILATKVDTTNNLIDDLNDRIDNYEDVLTLKEDRLYSQYAALEKAMSTLESQGSWLESQLSALSS